MSSPVSEDWWFNVRSEVSPVVTLPLSLSAPPPLQIAVAGGTGSVIITSVMLPTHDVISGGGVDTSEVSSAKMRNNNKSMIRYNRQQMSVSLSVSV